MKSTTRVKGRGEIGSVCVAIQPRAQAFSDSQITPATERQERQRDLKGSDDFSVHSRAQPVCKLDDRDLRAKSGPNRAHFKANNAPTNHCEMCGNLFFLIKQARGVSICTFVLVTQVNQAPGYLIYGSSGGDAGAVSKAA